MERPVISVKEAAMWVGSRTVLYELLGEGRITAIKLGTRTLVDVQSLKQLIEAAPPAQIRMKSRRHAK